MTPPVVQTVPTVPTSTYRLQLQPGFGFAEAAEAVPYLASLGVGHLYLSPILGAAPGSRHGYDVVDHARVSPELGGEDGFRALAAEARARGLGIVVDIVPNHMAIPAPESLNRQFWSVLEHGPASPFAHWFDIDWKAGGGRVVLPVLGAPLDEALPRIRVEDGIVRYHDHAFPLRAGTAALPPREALEAQHYRLADWHEGDLRGNYRRFFTISSLIGLRQEDESVFAATHEVVVRLAHEGLIHGLRVDHPDGLADPRGYLRRLRAAVPEGTWIVVEKILTGPEELPVDWPCAGTTGYDVLRRVDGVFTDRSGATALRALHHEMTGAAEPGFRTVAQTAKREVLDTALTAEVARLERVLDRAGVHEPDTGEALRALLSAVPAYRPYVVPGEQPPPEAVTLLGAALTQVPGRLAVTARRIADAALGHDPEFAVRFAQVASAVAAKGVEDRAFYRWYVLASLNEVGGEPDEVGLGVEEFHEYARALHARRPGTMTALSTHDTKRGEDVRARLAVLAEIPGEWASAVREWNKAAQRHRDDRSARLAPDRLAPDRLAPDRFDTYLLWQTLVGAWPIGPDRVKAYLRKAMREAARATSWTAPDTAYEQAVDDFVDAVLADRGIRASVQAFVERLAEPTRAVALGTKLIQLTMPGVPDVYQGGEGVLRTLVDPDNRSPVDFRSAAARLARLDAVGADAGRGASAMGGPDAGRGPDAVRGADAMGGTGAVGRGRGAGAVRGANGTPPDALHALHALDAPDSLDAEKALVTSAVLRLRRRVPEAFGAGDAGRYAAMHAHGDAAAHLLGLRRGPVVALATRLPVALAARGGWGNTRLDLWKGTWTDLPTGRRIPHDALLSEVFERLPVALLEATT